MGATSHSRSLNTFLKLGSKKAGVANGGRDSKAPRLLRSGVIRQHLELDCLLDFCPAFSDKDS